MLSWSSMQQWLVEGMALNGLSADVLTSLREWLKEFYL